MILRRITEHVKAQNWTAVALDFVIVVVGVFIGIQVSNWNEARIGKETEAVILTQLNEEFLEIRDALLKQIGIRENYVADIGRLVAGLEGAAPVPDDLTIKRGLVAVRSTGRRPARSAAYLQLTASGELARLSNKDLKETLIRYHTRLERDAFIIPELIASVIREISSNKFVDVDVNAAVPTGASVDIGPASTEMLSRQIRSYDLEKLRDYEERYEAMHEMHETLVAAEKIQLKIVDQILTEIAERRP